MIIGLVGAMGAGKGICAEYLGKRGFLYHSLSDEIREELKSRELPETRELLTSVGNELRTQSGTGILAQRVLKKMKNNKNYVVDSIRNPEEVKTLRTRKEFILIRIEAPVEIRYERIKNRGRTGDVQTLQQFLAQEKAESESTDINKQQMRATSSMADYQLTNNSSLDDFYHQIDKFLKEIAGRKSI